MYELADYLRMVEDPVRTPAYLAAMRARIRPGDTVLEIGTGFGFFAIEACRLGAAHVYAIEPNDAISLGPTLAAANGCADRITFIQDRSDRVRLPRRADLLIEDLRGVSPLHYGRLRVLADANERLLAPDARRIPAIDRLWCAPTEWPAGERPHEADAPTSVHGIDIGAVRALIARDFLRSHRGEEGLLAAGAEWAVLDLAESPGPHVRGESRFRVTRDGRFAGIASWFSTELAPGIGFDTAPGGPRTVYGRSVIPLETPLSVRRDDQLVIQLSATFDGADYVWVWVVQVEPADGTSPLVSRGTTLGARLMSAARRARRTGRHRPPLTDEILRRRTLLEAVDGTRSLDEIAARLCERHPGHFANLTEALRWAADGLAEGEEGRAE